MIRVVFFGTSAFAVPSLRALSQTHEIVAAYTQPDRPAGRGLRPTPTPVKLAALELGLPVRTPELLDAAAVADIAALRPRMLACAAYGELFPRALLDAPGMAALNVHPSLLPEYRGATPIQAALRDGRELTGVTVFWIAPKMDAGDIALVRTVPIAPKDNYGTLHDRLARVGAELIVEAANRLETGTLPRIPQRHEAATMTKPLTKEDLRLSYEGPAPAVVNAVRAAAPKPGAWTMFEGKRLKVLEARAEDGRAGAAPGSLLSLNGDGPLLACADGAVRLLWVVPEGRHPMTGAEFSRSLAGRR